MLQSCVNVLQLFPCQPDLCAMQSDVKKAVDAKAYPRVSADLRHHIGTLRCCNPTLIHGGSLNNAKSACKSLACACLLTKYCGYAVCDGRCAAV